MPPLPAPALKPRQRILVMRYRFIGDTLLMVPFLRNLRAAYPHAMIDLLAAPNSGELLRDCPYIDHLILFDTSRKHRYENPDSGDSPTSFWQYVQLLRKKRYDTAFVLKRSFSSAALAFLAGIPERIGFNTEGRGWLLTRRVPYPEGVHEIDAFLSVLAAAGLAVQDRHLESWWNPQEEEVADRRLREAEQVLREKLAVDGPLQHVVLHLTSSNPAKQWPLHHALALVNELLDEPGRIIHCLGAASDAPLYRELQKNLLLEKQSRLLIHCGQLSLLESMAFLKRMSLVVGVDSGTLHMASVAGVPVVALFGPMDERRWSPLGATILTNPVGCRPCNLKTPCAHEFICMQGLSPEAVMEKIRTYAGFA
jgi:heptosyltransferase-2